MYVLAGFADVDITFADDKAALIQALAEKPEGVVILDYTLFDLDGPEELFILSQRFRLVQWLLFSEELSLDFVRVVMAKEASMASFSKTRRSERLGRPSTLHLATGASSANTWRSSSCRPSPTIARR